jgi:hypothetical protein
VRAIVEEALAAPAPVTDDADRGLIVADMLAQRDAERPQSASRRRCRKRSTR